jgi:hypothetical protein
VVVISSGAAGNYNVSKPNGHAATQSLENATAAARTRGSRWRKSGRDGGRTMLTYLIRMDGEV